MRKYSGEIRVPLEDFWGFVFGHLKVSNVDVLFQERLDIDLAKSLLTMHVKSGCLTDRIVRVASFPYLEHSSSTLTMLYDEFVEWVLDLFLPSFTKDHVLLGTPTWNAQDDCLEIAFVACDEEQPTFWESVPLERTFLNLTSDSMSFQKINMDTEVEIPFGEHVGAFGVNRKQYVHKGVDLYTAVGTPVYAVENGIAVMVGPFTGPDAGSDWWLPTGCVRVAGKTGVIVYGEIEPDPAIQKGDSIQAGSKIGTVLRVLKKDKGRPTSMLHLALLRHGCFGSGDWNLGCPKPYNLLDPTPYLASLVERKK